MIQQIIIWYATLQLLAFAGLPLAFTLFERLPSRGYAYAKALGVLLIGIVFWWGGIIHLWVNNSAAVLTAAALIFALGLWRLRDQKSQIKDWWKQHRGYVFTVEVLFLLALVAWSLVRASQPQLQTAGGEKWMEIAFLNASLRSPSMPPHDPWLSGYAISYYYLGYILLAMVTRLSGLVASIAFNLSNAGWFAMAAVGAYGLVYDLLPRRDVIRPLLAPLMLLLTGNGEGLLEVLHARGMLPDAFWQWMNIENLAAARIEPFSAVPDRFFWWWQASRTIRDCAPWAGPWRSCAQPIEMIDEFPVFSFILGDMHPHLLALPFGLLVIALALQVFYKEQEKVEISAYWRERFVPLAVPALFLGAMGFLNTWDFPIYWALIVGVIILGRYVPHPRSSSAFRRAVVATLPDAVVLGLASIAWFFPFWMSLRSQAGGVLPNLFFATRLRQFTVMFIPLLVPVIGVVIQACRKTRVVWWRVLLTELTLIVLILAAGIALGLPTALPYLQMILTGQPVQGFSLTAEQTLAAIGDRWSAPWTSLLLAAIVGAILQVFTGGSDLLGWRAKKNAESTDDVEAVVDESEAPEIIQIIPVSVPHWLFPLVLVLMGALLTLAPEFVYLKDVFMARMNTIFKFYFLAWVFWSIAAAWQFAMWLEFSLEHKVSVWRGLAVVLTLITIFSGLVYTVLAIPARSREMGTPQTLDGAAWLATHQPGDYAAIQWLADQDGVKVIAEAPGVGSNSAYAYQGRISAFTGHASVLGWAGHELQWRGNYAEPALRESDLQTLFNTNDTLVTREILAKYAINYVYVGPVEISTYPSDGLAKFSAILPVVYSTNGVTIYEVMPDLGR